MKTGTAVVTGAGSGVGRCVAMDLLGEGWQVALVGRRAAALEETVARSGADVLRARVCPCDVGDPADVARMAGEVHAAFGPVEVLVNSAGTNAPRRAFDVLSLEDYHQMIQANLNGAFYCVQAFLPDMRSRGSGTIVNVVSEAGKLASPKAGPGYVVSKFGMAGLTQSINAEERNRGVRACALFPGDIDTPLLELRPNVPDAAARARMLKPSDVAACVLFCIRQPAHVFIEEMLVRPR